MTRLQPRTHQTDWGETTDMYLLPVGTKFHVRNGAWDGEIVERAGGKTLVSYLPSGEIATETLLDSAINYELVLDSTTLPD